MEKSVRKKRPQRAPPRKERRDSVKSGTKSRPMESVSKKSTKASASTSVAPPKPVHSVLGISLNAQTARQAVILSEIIGKPVSKRGRLR